MSLMDQFEKQFKEMYSSGNSSGSFETVSGQGDEMDIDKPVEVETQENDSDIEIIETK